MLAWTPAGAVQRPRILQIRMHSRYPDRVRAGAPVPTRAMSTEEVAANLRWFTAESARGLPVNALVLSGEGVPTREDLPELLALARGRGIERITLHVSAGDVDRVPVEGVDGYVIPHHAARSGPRSQAAIRALERLPRAHLTVDLGDLGDLRGGYFGARSEGAASLTYTFPLTEPTDRRVTVDRALWRLTQPGLTPDGVPVTIKGLPACWLGALAPLHRPTANRWYVDADHQQDAAVLFFPNVVRFAKGDACRFCARDATCDGPPAWLANDPGNPPLVPFD